MPEDVGAQAPGQETMEQPAQTSSSPQSPVLWVSAHHLCSPVLRPVHPSPRRSESAQASSLQVQLAAALLQPPQDQQLGSADANTPRETHTNASSECAQQPLQPDTDDRDRDTHWQVAQTAQTLTAAMAAGKNLSHARTLVRCILSVHCTLAIVAIGMLAPLTMAALLAARQTLRRAVFVSTLYGTQVLSPSLSCQHCQPQLR